MHTHVNVFSSDASGIVGRHDSITAHDAHITVYTHVYMSVLYHEAISLQYVRDSGAM